MVLTDEEGPSHAQDDDDSGDWDWPGMNGLSQTGIQW